MSAIKPKYKRRIRCEVISLITLKVMLLALLWYICFMGPHGKPIQQHTLSQHFFDAR